MRMLIGMSKKVRPETSRLLGIFRHVLNYIFSIFVVLLVPAESIAQENLAPDISYIVGADDYAFTLKSTFREGFNDEVVLRVIALPSFSPEYLAGVRKKHDKTYEAFVIEPTISIWDVESKGKKSLGEEKQKNKMPSTTSFGKYPIQTITISKPISEALANRLMKIWQEELLKVRYSKNTSLIVDGTKFHFSMFLHGFGVISGNLVNSQSGTRMVGLSRLATALAEFARGKIEYAALDVSLSDVEMYSSK